MIFSFGRGKIEVFLEKYNFSPGENIKGRISLKLKKPIRAKALKVGLVGEKKTTQYGASSTSQRKTHFYNFEMPLDGEREYLEGDYNFEIKIPANVLQAQPGGAVGDIVKGIQLLSGKDIKISWHVIAKLDIPSGLDVSKKVQVNIG
jgi:hypothetical protein